MYMNKSKYWSAVDSEIFSRKKNIGYSFKKRAANDLLSLFSKDNEMTEMKISYGSVQKLEKYYWLLV